MLFFGIDIVYLILICIVLLFLIITVINEIVRFLRGKNAIKIYEVSDAYTIEGTENDTFENNRNNIPVIYGTI
jgi:hypothetical protein